MRQSRSKSRDLLRQPCDAEATKLTQADVTLRSLSRDRLSGLELRQG